MSVRKIHLQLSRNISFNNIFNIKALGTCCFTQEVTHLFRLENCFFQLSVCQKINGLARSCLSRIATLITGSCTYPGLITSKFGNSISQR